MNAQAKRYYESLVNNVIYKLEAEKIYNELLKRNIINSSTSIQKDFEPTRTSLPGAITVKGFGTFIMKASEPEYPCSQVFPCVVCHGHVLIPVNDRDSLAKTNYYSYRVLCHECTGIEKKFPYEVKQLSDAKLAYSLCKLSYFQYELLYNQILNNSNIIEYL